VFSKFVNFCSPKAAKIKACLNKILNHYVANVRRPKCILSDNGTQFASQIWKNNLADMNIRVDITFSPVRHPQGNPNGRCIGRTGKFCRVYCQEAHKRCLELLSHIEGWLNGTLSHSTGYSPVALIFDSRGPDFFDEFIKKGSEQKPPAESRYENVLKTCQDEEEEGSETKQKGKEL
jgi:transposase InsO family protein